jgi:hypothetical protein
MTFGNYPVGVASAAQVVTLSNAGNASLTIAAIAVTGPNASDFTQTNTCASAVAAGASCTISVTFTPTASGPRNAAVTIGDNAASGSQTVTLAGTGTAPGVSLSPATLSFGSQAVTTASTPQSINLTNTGNASLSICSLALTGANASDFAQTNTCGSALAAGASCTITITFAPTTSGTRTASVTIADNAGGSPQTVTLSGTGSAPAVSLSPPTLSFGSQPVTTSSTPQSINLTNIGNASLSINSLALTGPNAGDFAQTNTCGSAVAAGASCTITITFAPTTSGTRTAFVTIADNAGGSPQTVTLSGSGTTPAVSLSPPTLSFGSQPVTTSSTPQSINLTNTGNASLTITSVAITGSNAGDFAEVNTCSSTVPASTSCTITVIFTPSTAGARAASLAITDNASGSPQTAGLSGTGSHDVVLSWSASTSPEVVGYFIYRGTTPGGESSTPLNSTLITGLDYTDENVVAGMTYYYVATAVASDGTQSAPSNEVSATVP